MEFCPTDGHTSEADTFTLVKWTVQSLETITGGNKKVKLFSVPKVFSVLSPLLEQNPTLTDFSGCIGDNCYSDVIFCMYNVAVLFLM
jgi:hypothetical protein